MRKIIIISWLSMLCLWLTACTDPFAKEEFMAYDEQPIGLHLETLPQYSQWVKLLKKADLFNAINISNVKYTCFIANNDAVDAYIQSSGIWTTIDDLTEEEAKNVLKYHIVPSSYAYTSLSSGRLGVRTASGDYLTLTTDVTDRYINAPNKKVVKILKKDEDVPQINGYYHEIESVLDPIIFTVMEVLEQNTDYTIFTEALKVSGLDVYLDRRDIEIDGTVLRDYKALLVVSDSMFYENKIRSVVDLNKLYDGEPSDVKSNFYKFIGFHILKDAYDYGALTEFSGTELRGANFETYITGEFISLEKTIDGANIYLNPLGPEENLHIVSDKYNVQACNGFIHEISGLMPISEPVRYPFTWEPTEWPEFRTIEFYREERAKGDGEPTNYHWFEENTDHVRWNTIPYKEEAVGYMSSDIDWDRFANDDGLIASLGPIGWIEFDTPTMQRGLYRISVVKWAWFENKGKFQMSVDGLKFGPEIDMSKAPGTMDLGIIRFGKLMSHVFRFNVTGGDGEFRIDRFIFTPINE